MHIARRFLTLSRYCDFFYLVSTIALASFCTPPPPPPPFFAMLYPLLSPEGSDARPPHSLLPALFQFRTADGLWITQRFGPKATKWNRQERPERPCSLRPTVGNLERKRLAQNEASQRWGDVMASALLSLLFSFRFLSFLFCILFSHPSPPLSSLGHLRTATSGRTFRRRQQEVLRAEKTQARRTCQPPPLCCCTLLGH